MLSPSSNFSNFGHSELAVTEWSCDSESQAGPFLQRMLIVGLLPLFSPKTPDTIHLLFSGPTVLLQSIRVVLPRGQVWWL